MSKILRFTLIASLSLAGMSALSSAQTAIIDKAVPQSVDLTNVIRAQHIKPGDVSPEEYQRLLDEADKVKHYQQATQPNFLVYDTDVTTVDYGQAPLQRHTQIAQDPHFQTSTTYVYDSAPAAIVTQVNSDDPVMSLDETYAHISNTPRNQPAATNQFQTVHVNTSPAAGYAVVQGDTLYNISRRNGISLADLKHANGLSSNDLSIGQMLTIPGTETISYRSNPSVSKNKPSNQVIWAMDAAPSNVYAVLPGDTVYSISRRACIGADQLSQINGLGSSAAIQPGQRLNLPYGHCLR